MAVFYHFSSQEINTRMDAVYTLIKKCPAWVRGHVDGARKVLTDKLYEENLSFQFKGPDELWISTRHFPDGWNHQRICSENLQGHHVWIGSNPIKVFF
jgi:hypothetical protein